MLEPDTFFCMSGSCTVLVLWHRVCSEAELFLKETSSIFRLSNALVTSEFCVCEVPYRNERTWAPGGHLMYSFAAFPSMLALPICDGSLGLLNTYITGNLKIRVIQKGPVLLNSQFIDVSITELGIRVGYLTLVQLWYYSVSRQIIIYICRSFPQGTIVLRVCHIILH